MKKTNIFRNCAGKAGTTTFAILMCIICHAQTNISYNRDISVSAANENYDPKLTFKKVMLLAGLKDTKDEINLSTSLTGESGIPRINMATLPSADGLSVLEHNRNLSIFLQKGLACFETIAQPATHRRTEIFRSLVAINGYRKSSSKREWLIFESDFISSGYVIEFFDYLDNPSALVEKDFDKILAAFKADNGGSLPDLTGAKVILLNHKGTDELSYWSTKFWRKAMLHFGAKEVMIKAAL